MDADSILTSRTPDEVKAEWKKRRNFTRLAWVLVAVCTLAVWVTHSGWLIVADAVLIVLLVGLFQVLSVFKCPKCESSIREHNPSFCPYCGCALT